MNQPVYLVPEVINVFSSIEATTKRLTGHDGFFGSLSSLNFPDFRHPELSMLRTVSLFYVMYHELGKPNIKFVIDKLDVYELDSAKKHRLHPVDVQKLRTLFQHNLDPTSSSDQNTRNHCSQWFYGACQSRSPKSEDEWSNSLKQLLQDAIDFLTTVEQCINSMEEDESAEQIVSQWKFRLQRHHPQHQFDRLIEVVAQDLGRSHIQPHKFSSRYYSEWVKELEVMENYDFEIAARRQIERAILEDTKPQLPIDGQDIMREFEIEPGRRVGDLLKRAMEIHDRSPCSREELIECLRMELVQDQSCTDE